MSVPRAERSFSFKGVLVKKTRALGCVALAAAGLCAVGTMGAGSAPAGKPKDAPRKTAAPRKATPPPSAPADEYFGRLKMSYLGMNNTLRDQAIRAGDYTIDTGTAKSADFVQDAMLDWMHKYPGDPQLPRTMFLMAKLYAKIWTAYGQDRAAHYFLELQHDYPRTYFGKLVNQQLSKGFTEHILADPLPCPTELPSATPTPALRRGATPMPSPSPTLSPSPTPTPTPVPTAPPNSNVHIQIIPVPCYKPTPSPSPTPVPTPSPAATVTPSVTPTVLPSGSLLPVPSPSPSPASSRTPTPAPRATAH